MLTTVVFGASGTGAAIACRLHAAGKRVHVISRNLQQLEQLKAAMPSIAIDACDVLDTPALENLCKAVAIADGGVEGFVYAIGSIPLKPLKSTTSEDFRAAFAVNTLGAAIALKHLAPALASGGAKRPGAVVFFSSVAAKVGFPNHAAIATAKAGLEGLALASAAELAPAVRINVISPSLTVSQLSSRLTSSETMRTSLGEAHPLQRLGSTEDLAAAACFLLDNSQSGWMSGQVVSVDGGRSTLRPKN